MSYEISLLKLIENRDAALYGRLLTLREIAKPLLSYTQCKFPHYTPHDFSHSEAVEENLNWLIPDQVKEKLHTFEIFFLLISAWLHDWGLIGEADENAELIRETHHIRTEQNFERIYEKINLSEQEARICGRICKGHRKIDLSSSDYDDVLFGHNSKIRLRFLAALLRIADECDITNNRTPEVIYFSINPIGDSECEFKKHLSITGIGQLSETHKIYISAIARDPKGARTLREVAQKVQHELDGVKAILADNDIPVDTVELRLETRGFIDKPISFVMDREKIVQLLIGDHLYANQDVAIRELIQNSLDSCSLKQTLEPNTSCKISIYKEGDTLVVEDNGLGIDFIDAKLYLSTIGGSFHNSKAFMENFEQMKYSPIALNGIGLLSCFLICDQMTIETYKENQEPCKFAIESVGQEWRYEKGSLSTTGTRITLKLNEYGQNIHVRESLERYFLCPEIPIEYRDGDGPAEIFLSEWSGNTAFYRFNRYRDGIVNEGFNETIKLSTNQYDLIFGIHDSTHGNQLILFNHGIYVGGFRIAGLSDAYGLAINMHTNLVDLHISRESVKFNRKWNDFVSMLFDNIFHALETDYIPCGKSNPMDIYSSMLDDILTFIIQSGDFKLEEHPFLNSFLKNAPFMVLTNGEIKSVLINDILALDGIPIYNCCSPSSSDEMDLLKKLSTISSIAINPYQFPNIRKGIEKNQSTSILSLLLKEGSTQHAELDLRTLLLKSSSEVESTCLEMLPKNVCLATFMEGIKPLVVVFKTPLVETLQDRIGPYWIDIILWTRLLHQDDLNSVMDSISEFDRDQINNINLIEEPIVYIDQSDTFVNALITANQNKQINDQISDQVTRYFKYLSYIPLAFRRLDRCLLLLGIISQLENNLSAYLNVKPPPPLFERMKPSSKVYLQYFEKFGDNYREKSSP